MRWSSAEKPAGSPHRAELKGWLASRLEHLETVLAARDWLAADRFTAADLLMADVLRFPRLRRFGTFPSLGSYVERVCSRRAFIKAREDQIAYFAAADARRASAT